MNLPEMVLDWWNGPGKDLLPSKPEFVELAEFDIYIVNDKLTRAILLDLPSSVVFKKGEGVLYGQVVKWVAKRGGIDDWAIYAGPLDWSWKQVLERGEKVMSEGCIKIFVDCTDEAYARYRY